MDRKAEVDRKTKELKGMEAFRARQEELDRRLVASQKEQDVTRAIQQEIQRYMGFLRDIHVKAKLFDEGLSLGRSPPVKMVRCMVDHQHRMEHVLEGIREILVQMVQARDSGPSTQPEPSSRPESSSQPEPSQRPKPASQPEERLASPPAPPAPVVDPTL